MLLVAGFFMHLISEKKAIYAVLLATVFFFAGMMYLTVWARDEMPRGTKYFGATRPVTTSRCRLNRSSTPPRATSRGSHFGSWGIGIRVVDGTPDEVVRHPEVVSSYLGTTEAVIARSGPTKKKQRVRNG